VLTSCCVRLSFVVVNKKTSLRSGISSPDEFLVSPLVVNRVFLRKGFRILSSKFINITFCDDADIDECETGTDHCADDAACSNSIGSHICTCNIGYQGGFFTCTGM